MNYLQAPFFRAQLVVQAVLLGVLFVLPSQYATNFLFALSLVLLAFVGIPHGANDLLYRKNPTVWGAAKFLAAYLGAMALYAGLWWQWPIVALVVFFLVSIHHFGQSNFEARTHWHAPALVWGFWLLVAPVTIHFEESTAIFREMTGGVGSFSLPHAWLLVVRMALLALYLFLVMRRYKAAKWQLLLQALLVAIWLETTPLVSGFIVVFALWHSSQSLYFQWKTFSSQRKKLPKAKVFWLNMVLFTLISFGFLFVIGQFVALTTAVLFVLLSIITLPHVVVMDGLYKQLPES